MALVRGQTILIAEAALAYDDTAHENALLAGCVWDAVYAVHRISSVSRKVCPPGLKQQLQVSF